jgi:iron complex transport system substrate-binding protein
MKKALSVIVALLMLMTLVTACSQNNSGTATPSQASAAASPSSSAASEPASPSPSASAQTEQTSVQTSTAFSIKMLDNGVKLVTDAENQKLLLVPRGQTAPTGYSDATVIYTPVEKVLYCSITQVCMLRPFGNLWNSVGGVMQDKGTWPFKEIEDGLANGSIIYVGDGKAPDYEKIKELNPDIAFVYTGDYGQQDIIAKLQELGIPYAVDNEYTEKAPEGRMDWIKFIGTFYNRDADANKYVNSQLDNIAAMKETVKNAAKPKVMWAMIYNGIVYVPNGGSYVAKSIEEAGGDYLYKDLMPDSGSSSQITLEDFYQKLKEADVWIYSSNKDYVPDYAALSTLAPITDDAAVVTNKAVWQFSVDYYAEADKSDQQVVELAAIFHPELYPNYQFAHYNKLAG